MKPLQANTEMEMMVLFSFVVFLRLFVFMRMCLCALQREK